MISSPAASRIKNMCGLPWAAVPEGGSKVLSIIADGEKNERGFGQNFKFQRYDGILSTNSL